MTYKADTILVDNKCSKLECIRVCAYIYHQTSLKRFERRPESEKYILDTYINVDRAIVHVDIQYFKLR